MSPFVPPWPQAIFPRIVCWHTEEPPPVPRQELLLPIVGNCELEPNLLDIVLTIEPCPFRHDQCIHLFATVTSSAEPTVLPPLFWFRDYFHIGVSFSNDDLDTTFCIRIQCLKLGSHAQYSSWQNDPTTPRGPLQYVRWQPRLLLSLHRLLNPFLLSRIGVLNSGSLRKDARTPARSLAQSEGGVIPYPKRVPKQRSWTPTYNSVDAFRRLNSRLKRICSYNVQRNLVTCLFDFELQSLATDGSEVTPVTNFSTDYMKYQLYRVELRRPCW